LQSGRIDNTRNGLSRASVKQLSLSCFRIGGSVEIEAGKLLAPDAAPLNQLAQGIVHFDMQSLSEFLRCFRSQVLVAWQ